MSKIVQTDIATSTGVLEANFSVFAIRAFVDNVKPQKNIKPNVEFQRKFITFKAIFI